MTTEERFWSKVDKSGECWLWTAARCWGYGYFRDGVSKRAHRVSYEWEYGPIPKDLVVDHKCHNKACVRPSHLRLATVKQNGENRKSAQRNSKTGIRGVSWNCRAKMWQASVQHHGRRYHLGMFDKLEDAGYAVVEKRKELFTHNDSDRA